NHLKLNTACKKDFLQACQISAPLNFQMHIRALGGTGTGLGGSISAAIRVFQAIYQGSDATVFRLR
ncbi:MAG: hypothetical protein ACOC3F_02175, partial [Desulfosudaceae bacterium]